MSLATDNLGFSIGRPKTGSARVYDLALTGWGANITDVTQGGVVYYRVTAGSMLELFNDEGYASGNRIAYGAITAGNVILSQDNSSGISGTAKVTNTSGTESRGRMIISYADVRDLAYVMHSYTNLLDESDNWIGGGVGFESPLLEAKKELDQWIAKGIALRSASNAGRERDLADIAKPRSLARTHALLTAAHLEEHAASINMNQEAQVSRYRKMADSAWTMLELEWDYEDDGMVDYRTGFTTLRVTRG